MDWFRLDEGFISRCVKVNVRFRILENFFTGFLIFIKGLEWKEVFFFFRVRKYRDGK